MSDTWLAAARWLLHAAGGGGLLLMLTWLAVRWVRQPARQQRLAEWGVAASLVLAALCLTPSWLLIPLPVPTGSSSVVLPQGTAEPAVPTRETPQGPQNRGEKGELPAAVEPPAAGQEQFAVGAEAPPLPGPAGADREARAKGADAPRPDSEHPLLAVNETASGLSWETVLPAVVCLYFAGTTWMVVRLARGYRHLSRLLRSAAEAPQEVRQLFETMFPFRRRPRLLVSCLVRVPLSCGVLRPTVALRFGPFVEKRRSRPAG